ncbi:hypothetical protein [Hyalangium rubrum]|uniref:Uncharacterized protein n=1 Tax=Hyalangium rubrum TaxID=3103134 RepID=A0ABU5HH98_9BACT|nr:hypothetical protein [Hyalangium sp. s54d21]MDY7232833.1 hypothetical protein [Hyalangium sp. s54d21]
MNPYWQSWISANWSALSAGQKLRVPSWLPHPSRSGLERPPLAEPVGQAEDWVVSYMDGSRIHVHEYSNGSMIVHRDETDPKRGPMEAMWHWLTESTSGKTTLAVAGIIVAAKAVSALSDED